MAERDETKTLFPGLLDFAALSCRDDSWHADGEGGEPSFPLLELRPELMGRAVAVQRCIRRCLETKQLRERTCSVEHVSPASEMVYIVLREAAHGHAQRCRVLLDEAYCQVGMLLGQTRHALVGMKLLLVCSACFPASPALADSLLQTLQTLTETTFRHHPRKQALARACVRGLHAVTLTGVRSGMPSAQEVVQLFSEPTHFDQYPPSAATLPLAQPKASRRTTAIEGDSANPFLVEIHFADSPDIAGQDSSYAPLRYTLDSWTTAVELRQWATSQCGLLAISTTLFGVYIMGPSSDFTKPFHRGSQWDSCSLLSLQQPIIRALDRPETLTPAGEADADNYCGEEEEEEEGDVEVVEVVNTATFWCGCYQLTATPLEPKSPPLWHWSLSTGMIHVAMRVMSYNACICDTTCIDMQYKQALGAVVYHLPVTDIQGEYCDVLHRLIALTLLEKFGRCPANMTEAQCIVEHQVLQFFDASKSTLILKKKLEERQNDKERKKTSATRAGPKKNKEKGKEGDDGGVAQRAARTQELERALSSGAIASFSSDLVINEPGMHVDVLRSESGGKLLRVVSEPAPLTQIPSTFYFDDDIGSCGTWNISPVSLASPKYASHAYAASKSLRTVCNSSSSSSSSGSGSGSEDKQGLGLCSSNEYSSATKSSDTYPVAPQPSPPTPRAKARAENDQTKLHKLSLGATVTGLTPEVLALWQHLDINITSKREAQMVFLDICRQLDAFKGYIFSVKGRSQTRISSTCPWLWDAASLSERTASSADPVASTSDFGNPMKLVIQQRCLKLYERDALEQVMLPAEDTYQPPLLCIRFEDMVAFRHDSAGLWQLRVRHAGRMQQLLARQSAHEDHGTAIPSEEKIETLDEAMGAGEVVLTLSCGNSNQAGQVSNVLEYFITASPSSLKPFLLPPPMKPTWGDCTSVTKSEEDGMLLELDCHEREMEQNLVVE